MTKDDRVNRRLDNYSGIPRSRNNIRSSIIYDVPHFKIFKEYNKNTEDKITISTEEKTKNDKGGK